MNFMPQSIEERMEDALQEKANKRFAVIDINDLPSPEKVDEFMRKVVKAIAVPEYEPELVHNKHNPYCDINIPVSYLNFYNDVKLLVSTFPNDAELGAAVRQYVN